MEELYDRLVQVAKKRLEEFGVTISGEVWSLRFIVENKVWYILTEINHAELPEELEKVCVDLVCGEFLSMKKSLGKLEGFTPSLAVKQITEGDVSVTYQDGKTTDQLIDWLIATLLSSGRDQWSAYRKMRW